MQDILIRAGCFVAIIILGYLLRKFGVFQGNAFSTLSQIALKLTLPATIVVSFSQMDIPVSMLYIMLLSFCCGIIYIGLAFLINIKSDKKKKAFDILNIPGYNIGLFAMPFVQSFLGPAGVVATGLFDAGNAVICLGSSYGIACSVQDGKGISFRRIGKALLSSVPFVTYITMLLLNFTGITLPAPVLSFADIIKNANVFIAMLMIGVGFKLEAEKSQIWQIARILVVRYSTAAVFACLFYFVLPLPLEIRQTLTLLAFSPISAAVPAFTGEMKSDVGLSSAISSAMILCSIVFMTVLISVIL